MGQARRTTAVAANTLVCWLRECSAKAEVLGARDIVQLSGHFPLDATKHSVEAFGERSNIDLEIISQTEDSVAVSMSSASQYLPAIFQAINEAGGSVTETSLRSPNLETLFLLLTGKELRE